MKLITHKMLPVVLLAVLTGGCATRDYSKGHATARSIEKTSTRVQIQSDNLDLAISALKDLINSPSDDLRYKIERYRNGVDVFESASNRTQASAEEMRKLSTKFFQQWDTELEKMNYQAVRDRSQARRAEVEKRFDLVSQRCAEVHQVVQPLISYLRDIEKALGTDLTLEGLGSLKPIAENAEKNADKVELALAKLADALKDAGSRMSPIITHQPAGS